MQRNRVQFQKASVCSPFYGRTVPTPSARRPTPRLAGGRASATPAAAGGVTPRPWLSWVIRKSLKLDQLLSLLRRPCLRFICRFESENSMSV